ncbi:unnamed protein product [Moneuplotes crassus]|uniref:Alpha-tubulin N-acetyltransferase n=2 Tax=Euplotes crassus TaxID=5936 RepID=A0AAD1USI8_EUPCR|nr:unnamed protein product [Moneuplotes crassus]
MEFRTNLSELLKSKAVKRFPKENDADDECFIVKIIPTNVIGYGIMDDLNSVIDKMGDASSFAQGIHIPITSSTKFKSSDHELYIKVQGKKCYGFIKTGYKNLFVREYSTSAMINIKPLCILDFYVNEKCQRAGHGKDLFDSVLETEKIEPKMLAYDRPSFKYLAFLKKYYGLHDYYPQSNSFVVFKEYFEALAEQAEAERQKKEAEYSQRQQYFNPYDTKGYAAIGRKQAGVFTAIGSEIMKRSDSVNNQRSYTSPYGHFQEEKKRSPNFSYNNFNRAHSLMKSQNNNFGRKGTMKLEEAKAPLPGRDERLSRRIDVAKKQKDVPYSMVNMMRGTGVFPHTHIQITNFNLTNRSDKLNNPNAEIPNHSGMYTTTASRVNSRVNLSNKSHCPAPIPFSKGTVPFMWE